MRHGWLRLEVVCHWSSLCKTKNMSGIEIQTLAKVTPVSSLNQRNWIFILYLYWLWNSINNSTSPYKATFIYNRLVIRQYPWEVADSNNFDKNRALLINWRVFYSPALLAQWPKHLLAPRKQICKVISSGCMRVGSHSQTFYFISLKYRGLCWGFY